MFSNLSGYGTQQFKNYDSLVKELQLYFDQALPVLLLYRQEQEQVHALNDGTF